MDGSYRPQSPDLTDLRPATPDPAEPLPNPAFSSSRLPPTSDHFGPSFAADPSFDPSATSPSFLSPHSQFQPPRSMARSRPANLEDDDDFLPDAPSRRSRRAHQQSLPNLSTDLSSLDHQSFPSAPFQPGNAPSGDPTLGVQLKTSFPVARIKRIMQADEDIGKVAQVTPHVVSRALELFMIKLISASATQARGPTGKGPKKIQVQHLKKAVMADETFDFLQDTVSKVPDAPTKAKREPGSDSEDGASGGQAKAGKRRGRKKKESMDDH